MEKHSHSTYVKNVKWHDGVAFNSTDVLWTLNYILTKKNLADILGIDGANILSVTSPDKYTVLMKTK